MYFEKSQYFWRFCTICCKFILKNSNIFEVFVQFSVRVLSAIVDSIRLLENCFQGAERYCRFNRTIAELFPGGWALLQIQWDYCRIVSKVERYVTNDACSRRLSAIADPMSLLQNCVRNFCNSAVFDSYQSKSRGKVFEFGH